MKITILFVILCIVNISIAEIHPSQIGHDIESLGTVASNKTDTNEFERKAAHREEGAQMSESKGDTCSAAYWYYQSAIEYKELGNTNKSTELFNKAASLFVASGKEDDISLCASIYTYESAAEAYKEVGNTVKSNELFNKTAQKYEQKAQRYNSGGYYIRAADLYKKASNTIKAIEMYTLAAPLLEQSAIMNQHFDIHYVNAADAYTNSAKYYKQAADVYKQLGNKSNAIEMYTLAAELYTAFRENDRASEMRSQIDSLQREL